MFRSIKVFAAALLLAGASQCAQAQVVISQVYGGGGNSGATYTHDFIEIFNAGAAAQNLNNWSVQYTSSAGTVWSMTPLTNITLQPGQYYLIQQAIGGAGTTPLPTPDAIGTLTMSATNGKVILAKVTTAQSGACPSGADIADLVGFGSANCASPTAVLSSTTAAIRKSLGCTNTGVNSADFNVAAPIPRNTSSTLNPCGGPGVPAISIGNVSTPEGDSGLTPMIFTVTVSPAVAAGGLTFNFATANGSATAPADYQSESGSRTLVAGDTTTTITVNAVANITPQSNRTFTLNLTAINGALPATLSAIGTIQDDDIANRAIHEIQGSGLVSPIAGQRVRLIGDIVTAIGSEGFFVQTPDAAIDADPLTSQGIYVFTGSAPSGIQVGDAVTLVASAVEFSGLTELTTVSGLSVSSSGNALPAPIAFNDSLPSPDPANLSCGTLSNLECFEGMRVSVANGIVARGNQYFASDVYGQIFVSAGATRSLRSAGTLYPLVPGVDNPDAGAFTGNPHIFELDADALLPAWANIAITGGSRFSATGVLQFNFGDYDLLPTEFSLLEDNVLPRAVPAGQGGAELRIGSFNMLRLCDTLDNTPSECADYDGAVDAPAQLALKLARLSDYVGNVLELPDVLGVVEVENLAVLQLLANRIALDHAVTYTAYLEEGNDPGGIDVGYLVRSDRISSVVVTQLDKTEMWFDPDDNAMDTLNDRPSLRLEASFAGTPFTTIVVHPKSRSCVDRPTGTSCTQANVDRNRMKRFNQAKSIAVRVQEQQTLHPQRALLVIGDFNDYQFSDGFVHITGLIEGTYDNAANVLDLDANIVTPALWNAVISLPLNEQYSFLFTEQFGAIFGYTTRDVPIMQALDHALLNTVARSWFAGFNYGRADLDAADQTERLSTSAIGVSDHDGLVVRLATDRIFADSFGGD